MLKLGKTYMNENVDNINENSELLIMINQKLWKNQLDDLYFFEACCLYFTRKYFLKFNNCRKKISNNPENSIKVPYEKKFNAIHKFKLPSLYSTLPIAVLYCNVPHFVNSFNLFL